MPGTITLNIPLKTYLKKYLIQKYGDTHYVSRRSWLGKYLISILDKQYRKAKVDISKDSFYTISVPPTIVKEVGFNISAVKMKYLEEMIQKVFLNDLYSYIEISVGSRLKFLNKEYDSINKQNTMQAIVQFLKFYEIAEDEVSIDSLYRTFYRYRKSDKSLHDIKYKVRNAV
ncbi:hypothetical protein [Leptobacterium sp. I13]|uniref:hypothetical protein n=1 Tax=Leptobacterium meishanense TaxID=3128904 RepID=UPI0030EEC0C9